MKLQNTNVVELYSRLEKNKTQLTYYDSGIGTYVKESNAWRRIKQSVAHTWDMAVAWYAHRIVTLIPHTNFLLRNLKRIILDAYRWLSDNYIDGDIIFLFGGHFTWWSPLSSYTFCRFFTWCIPSTYYFWDDRYCE